MYYGTAQVFDIQGLPKPPGRRNFAAFQGAPLLDIHGFGQPETAPSSNVDRIAALGTATLVTAAILGVAMLGGIGYVIGRAAAPSGQSRSAYGIAGGVSNVFFPLLGPAVVAGVGLANQRGR